jgi:uncharacterized protein YgiM (DUF1202 family)
VISILRQFFYSGKTGNFNNYCNVKDNIEVGVRLLFLTCLLFIISGCRGPRGFGRIPHPGMFTGTPGHFPGPKIIPGQPLPQNLLANANGTISGVKGANVRKGPGTSNSVIGSLAPGAKITILDKQNNWYHIRTPINGVTQEGWVYGSLVQVTAPVGVVKLQSGSTTTSSNRPN